MHQDSPHANVCKGVDCCQSVSGLLSQQADSLLSGLAAIFA
jgi:hypothetical protein